MCCNIRSSINNQTISVSECVGSWGRIFGAIQFPPPPPSCWCEVTAPGATTVSQHSPWSPDPTNSLHPGPKMLSRLLSTTFQIGQGLNWNSSRWLIMARIRIVNYGNCQESIVALRNWRGLSALAHWKESLSRSLSSEVSLSTCTWGFEEEKPGWWVWVV